MDLLKQFVRELRYQRPTKAGSLLWECLRGGTLGVKFRRQHNHQLPQQQISDAERTSCLNSAGYKAIRFSNEEIISEIDKVISVIKQELHERNE